MHLKETELTAEERRLANFVDFIGEGRGSRSLAQALLESERKVEALKEELESLRRCRGKVFQVPPLEWIQERLTKLEDILERNLTVPGCFLGNSSVRYVLRLLVPLITSDPLQSHDFAQYLGFSGSAD
jgi:hypothetical protein